MTEAKRLVELFDGSFVDLDSQLKIFANFCWSGTKLLGYQAVIAPLFDNSKIISILPIGPRRLLNLECEKPYAKDASAPLLAEIVQDIEVFAHAAGYKIFYRNSSLHEVEAHQQAQQRLQSLLVKKLDEQKTS